MIEDLEKRLAVLTKEKRKQSKTIELLNQRISALEEKYQEDITSLQKKIDGAKEALREFKEVMSNQEKLVKKEIHILGLEMNIHNLNAEIHGSKDDILQNQHQLKRKKNLKI